MGLKVGQIRRKRKLDLIDLNTYLLYVFNVWLMVIPINCDFILQVLFEMKILGMHFLTVVFYYFRSLNLKSFVFRHIGKVEIRVN